MFHIFVGALRIHEQTSGWVWRFGDGMAAENPHPLLEVGPSTPFAAVGSLGSGRRRFKFPSSVHRTDGWLDCGSAVAADDGLGFAVVVSVVEPFEGATQESQARVVSEVRL